MDTLGQSSLYRVLHPLVGVRVSKSSALPWPSRGGFQEGVGLEGVWTVDRCGGIVPSVGAVLAD